MPPEKMDGPVSGPQRPLVRMSGGRLEFVFCLEEPKVRIGGHTVCASEGPMVFIGGRKMPVSDVY